MYRAVTHALLERFIDVNDLDAIEKVLPELSITFELDTEKDRNITFLNGINVEEAIRGMEVSTLVSPVSKINSVRKHLVALQREMGKNKGVVMDGRDIGTVVFPDAELKLFMTAQPEIRARRRFDELRRNGDLLTTYDEVLFNLNQRDLIDSSRENSPLKPAEDAIIIDNSFMTKDEQFSHVLTLALNVIEQSA